MVRELGRDGRDVDPSVVTAMAMARSACMPQDYSLILDGKQIITVMAVFDN